MKISRTTSILLSAFCITSILISTVKVSQGQPISPPLPWNQLLDESMPLPNISMVVSRNFVCSIAPANSEKILQVWHEKPLFIWIGSIRKIEVRPRGSQELLWSQIVQENDNRIIYSGTPLKPGTRYDMVLFDDGYHLISQITFQMVKEEDSKKINSDLKQREAEVKRSGATPETIAYTRAQYFAARQMWADVLQEAYSVENPSETLTQFQTTIPGRFCQ